MTGGSEDRDEDGERRRRAALVGLVLILALAAAGVVLVRALVHKSELEACLMSGRRNCAPIEAPGR
jgi:hypothetical protein